MNKPPQTEDVPVEEAPSSGAFHRILTQQSSWLTSLLLHTVLLLTMALIAIPMQSQEKPPVTLVTPDEEQPVEDTDWDPPKFKIDPVTIPITAPVGQ